MVTQFSIQLVSRSQTLYSIPQHCRGKGLVALPGDDVSLPLVLGEVINVNWCFDLLHEHFGCVCAWAMALALENDLWTVIVEVVRGHGYQQLSATEKFVSGEDVSVSLPTGFRNPLSTDFYPQYSIVWRTHRKRHIAVTSFATACYNINSLHLNIKICRCVINTLTPCKERGRNQYCIAKLPDPFLCGVAQLRKGSGYARLAAN